MSEFRTPLSRVRGHGSARDGTMNFWRQRLTAVANVPLTLFAAGFVAALAGAGHAQVVAAVRHPIVAVLLILMIASVTVHMRIGVKEVIEDYVHGEMTKLIAVLASTAFSALVGGVSIFAILKIAFGG